MSSILVVGSVALDSVKTPAGESREALGGSAVYFSLAARLFSRVHLVGVVGKDFPKEHKLCLSNRGVDIDGLEVLPGKTFRWAGAYGRNLNNAKTLDTKLNVFETFKPKLNDSHKQAPVAFLANIDPELQWDVLSQMTRPSIVACDTMNFWITLKKPALKELLSRVDIFFVNEEEARKLSGEKNNFRAAKRLSQWGPSVIVIKKGEHGAMLWANNKLYAFPAYPLEDVADPTGAGDTFAGGFLGYLASSGPLDGPIEPSRLKRAMLYGTVLASFNVEDFSTRRLERLEHPEVHGRFRDFVELLTVEDLVAA